MKIEIKEKEDFYEIFVNGKNIGLTYNPKRVDEIVKESVEAPNALKKCYNCGITRPQIMFYKRSKSPDGHQSLCIICNHDWKPAY